MFDMFIKHVNIICLHGSAHIGGQQCMTDARRFSEALCLLQQGAAAGCRAELMSKLEIFQVTLFVNWA